MVVHPHCAHILKIIYFLKMLEMHDILKIVDKLKKHVFDQNT